MRVPSLSLRARMICLVILAIIPTFVLTLYSARERLEHEMSEVHAMALQVVRNLAESHDEAMEETRLLLVALALFPSVQEREARTCSEIFTHLQRSHPSCIELAAVDPGGRVFCSAGPARIHENIAETSFFQRLLETRDYAASDYAFLSGAGAPAMTLARPALDSMNRVKAIVYASMDLSWVNRVAREGHFPENTCLLVVDNLGRILVRYPNPELWSSRIMPEAPVVATMLDKPEGVCEVAGVDGAVRFYAFTTLWRTSPNYLHVAVGIPREAAYVEVTKALRLNLVFLGILLAVALAAAFWGTEFLILRQIRGLLQVTGDVADGNLSVRTGPPYGRDELGMLARAFDGMSEALEQREIERENASKQILRQSALLEAVNRVLQETFTGESVEDVARKCLAAAQELTGSRMGFIGEIDEAGLFSTIAMAHSGEKTCRMPEFIAGDGLRDMEIRGIWGAALRSGLSLMVNDPGSHPDRTGTPEGHPPLIRFLGVPLKHGDVVFGVVALGNKETDYNRDDLESIETLAVGFVEALVRKRTEAALVNSEEEYRTLFESSRDAIMLLDRGGYIDCNTTAIEMFGFTSKDQFLGKHPGELSPSKQPDDRDSYTVAREHIESAYLEGVRFFEFDHRRRNGTVFPAEILLSRLEVRGKTILQAVVRDISRRKKLEEQLRMAQKLEAIGTLAGGIAHDFNNVLGIIIGYAELMESSFLEESMEMKHIEEILKACSRAKDVIRQILTVSRSGGELERKLVNICPIVLETMRFLRASIPSTIEIQEDIACENASVLTHPVEVHQILTNLCTNAAHAMEEGGGVLQVSLANVNFDSAAIPPFSDVEPGEYVMLTVSDTGHGMNKETMERIFDPYFTTKEVGKGSGLGLAVVHGILKRLGGAITVYSEADRGTTFQVYLRRHEAVAGMASEERLPIPKGVERILFVDDEAALVDIWQNILKKLGYSVVALTSGRAALELFRAQPEDFDLVITDFTMPHITGLELAREIASIRSDMPIILCTGLATRIAAAKSLEPAIRALLGKPLNVRVAAETIRNVLDKRTG